MGFGPRLVFGPAELAGKNISQRIKKGSVVCLFLLGRISGVGQGHAVQKDPRGRAPRRGIGKDVIVGFAHKYIFSNKYVGKKNFRVHRLVPRHALSRYAGSSLQDGHASAPSVCGLVPTKQHRVR